VRGRLIDEVTFCGFTDPTDLRMVYLDGTNISDGIFRTPDD
jgi:hypothetical protein